MKPGKLKHKTLEKLLSGLSSMTDPRVIVGPKVGEDAAVVQLGRQCMVIATDPVTFATDHIGWYAVKINSNDVATMGAKPAWFQVCVLLPVQRILRTGKRVRADRIFADIGTACKELNVIVTGGHTEVTAGIEEPIVIGTMMGLVSTEKLVTSSGLQEGDDIVMTGFAAIEATAILARDFAGRIRGKVPDKVLSTSARFLFDPGISVVTPALLAAGCGATAMHDPTEGGIITGLWEMAQSSGKHIVVDETAIPVRNETLLLTELFNIDPLRSIASGSLLIGIPASKTNLLLKNLSFKHITASKIGECSAGEAGLWNISGKQLKPQARDEIAKI